MSLLLHRAAAAGAATLLALVTATTAYADDVANNLDATIDATAEQMALVTGGPDGSTQLRVQPRNGDGDTGCNLAGADSATFSVSSSHPLVASVSPPSVTFDSCDDVRTLSVTPKAAGSTTVLLTLTASTSPGTFNTAPATFTVTVAPPPNTAPSVVVTGIGRAVYELGVDALPTPGCAASDAEDGPSQPVPTVDDQRDALGLGQVTVSCSVTDRGGLTDTDTASFTVVDTLAPTITLASRLPAANAHGWNGSPVTATWTCADLGVGVADPTVSATTIGEGQDLSLTGTCTDRVGHTASDTVTGIDVDLTAPTVAWVGGIPDGSSYYFGWVPPAPTCTASDDLSGVDGECAVTGHATTVGSHTVSAAARDRAGNGTTLESRYQVLAWTLKGFYQPVDMAGVLNAVKGGSTVPLKFEAFAGPHEITDVATLGATFSVRGVSCGTGAVVDDVELTATGGTALRYDATAGQFVQNWQTPKNPGACYQVTLTTADGSTRQALFKLR